MNYSYDYWLYDHFSFTKGHDCEYIVKKIFVEEKSILNDSPIILNLK